MSSPVDLLAALVDALKADDEAAVRALIAPDFVQYVDEGMPYGGTYHGPDGFLELCARVWKTWGGTHFEPQYQIADPNGTKVCTVVKFQGTTGTASEPLETILAEVFDFRDGQAVEARVWYFDTARCVRAIEAGALEARGSTTAEGAHSPG